jgi:hypothetical protein
LSVPDALMTLNANGEVNSLAPAFRLVLEYRVPYTIV